MCEVWKGKSQRLEQEKQELVGVSGLTLDFLSSSELLVIGSRV